MAVHLVYGREAVTRSVISSNCSEREWILPTVFLPKSGYIYLINSDGECGERLMVFFSELVGFLAPSIRTKI